MSGKFRILSLDGGGLRGLTQLIILKRIEEKTGKRIHELFDLIIGTSTGAIIAAGLTATKNNKPCLTIDKLIDLYFDHGDKIFPTQSNYFKRFLRTVRTLGSSKYKVDGLKGQLEKYFGDIRLSETIKPIIATSYDVENNEVIMFKTRRTDEFEYDLSLVDVCLSSTAAPSYFPPHEMNWMGVNGVFVDGGIYINNPSMAAVADALRYNYGREDLKIEDIQLLSIGTGIYSKKIKSDSKDWGIAKWAVNITGIMMHSTSKSVEYECEQMPFDKYLRLQFVLEEKEYIEMDDSRKSTLKELISYVNNQILNKRFSEIESFFE
jgi:hypothetical protein